MSPAARSATQPSTLAFGDSGDEVWIARRMVLDAGAQAATLRRRASVQAATISEAAEREAEFIWQQASMRADAIREAAERETAELRAAVMRLSAAPGEPAPVPEANRGHRRATGPGERPTRRRPQSRQFAALRVAVAATAALVLFALTAGTVEIVLHGFAFFVFRSVGTGETGRGPGGLTEDQGPGQPDAPKPAPSHIKAQLRPRGAVTAKNGS